ncbi:MAG: mannose-6-phosphate isomerase, class I [Lentisphaeria bacterium]
MFFELARFLPLGNRCCHYAWGSRAKNGHIPYLAELFSLPDNGQPLAELWIGAHPSMSSMVNINGQRNLLNFLISDFPEEILGEPCLAAGFKTLPFLLKILSCEHPLSIQCHPDLKTAAHLHAQFPESYPDSNHKPEILLALTPFEALAGFRALNEIHDSLAHRGLFHDWLDLWEKGSFTVDIRGLCQALFAMPEAAVQTMLLQAKNTLDGNSDPHPCEQMFLRLLQEYPCDRGCLFAFLLNHICLTPGQAIFLPPGQVHAYLDGTGVECMASSDNVIRAGLTSKKIAPDEFLQTADFSPAVPQIQAGDLLAPGKRSYPVPLQEFRLTMLEQAGLNLADCPETPGILLILQGKGELCNPDGTCLEAVKGSAWLRPAKQKSGTFTPLADDTLAVWCEANV